MIIIMHVNIFFSRWLIALSSPPVHDVAWAPDDSLLASCSVDNTVRIWRIPLDTGDHGGGGGGGGVGMVLAPEVNQRTL